MLVKVHAVIWRDGGVLVHEQHRQRRLHRTLPGGRVLDRERVEVALRREVEEELGIPVLVGRLHYVLEAVHGHTLHDVGLVFGAQALAAPGDGAVVVDPTAPPGSVFPPILGHVAADGPSGPASPRWLGNVWCSRQ